MLARKLYPKRGLLLVALLVIIGLFGAMPPASATTPAPPRLYLHRGTFGTRSGVQATQVAELLRAAPALAIIQFHQPITPADRDALQRTGAEILEYLPDYAYLLRGSSAQLQAAAQLAGVYVRTSFVVADKLAPELAQALAQGVLREPLHVTMQSWPGQETALAASLKRLGIDPQQPLDSAQIVQAANLPALRWIEPTLAVHLLNDSARAIMHVPEVWADHGIYGRGQVIGIADSGLDVGTTEALSPDFAGRIVATQVLSPGGDIADQFGHGTHVAGSVAGAGVLSGANPAQHDYAGSFAGIAPEASLVIQAFETSPEGGVLGLGDDPYPVFAQAYDAGVRIHTNSWGGTTGGIPIFETDSVFGRYPSMSMRTDQFLWDHPDMTIFFAAGNSGNDGLYTIFGCLPFGQDGVVDLDSLNAPGTAKNVVTVGAAESVRANAPGSAKTWKDFSSSCFGSAPLASDPLSDNAAGMAAFSSRGPADDGRSKPDLVAPGTNILSARTHMPGANKLWGLYEPNPNYIFSGGTSMATPLAAGAGVLVREWLVRRGLANPSAAAVKATLLNTAADLAPGQYGTGAAQEIPPQRPNPVTGWGRVDLGFITAPPEVRFWIDDHIDGLATGQLVRYTGSATQPLVVQSSAIPLRVMLVWTDPPASLTAAKQLVNDLDLRVIAPDGQVYWGNEQTNGDRTNNAEGIVIAHPLPGAYTIEVRAHQVPIDTQAYALAVGGAVAPGAAAPAPRLYVPMVSANQ